MMLTSGKLSLRFTVLTDVSSLLYRHSQLPQPILFLLRWSLPAAECHWWYFKTGKRPILNFEVSIEWRTYTTQSLDQLLSEKVCQSLVERLSSQYLGQIVQILINLEHFETACQELEQLLIAARSSSSAGGPIVLNATEEFRSNKKTAEKRIFELVNSKIDDLVETAEYDWYVYVLFHCYSSAENGSRMASTLESEPSNYMQTLTRYLSNIMNSTLLGLPREIKDLIYFDALSHAANMILVSSHSIDDSIRSFI